MTQDAIVKEQVKYDVLAAIETNDMLAYLERYEIELSEGFRVVIYQAVARNDDEVLYSVRRMDEKREERAVRQAILNDISSVTHYGSMGLEYIEDRHDRFMTLVHLVRLYAEVLANMDDILQERA